MKQIVAFYDRGVAIVSGRLAESVALLLLRVALGGVFWRSGQTKAVSYTHLDVYKRQPRNVLILIGVVQHQ